MIERFLWSKVLIEVVHRDAFLKNLIKLSFLEALFINRDLALNSS